MQVLTSKVILICLLQLSFVAFSSASPAGCFNHGECLGGDIVGSVSGISSLGDCLTECQSNANCEVVTFYPGELLKTLDLEQAEQARYVTYSSFRKVHALQSVSYPGS